MLIKCVCLLCCEEVTCNADGVAVRNGQLSGGKNTLGSKRKVTCTSGFKIAGPNETECKSDGEWSVKTFNCLGIYTHMKYDFVTDILTLLISFRFKGSCRDLKFKEVVLTDT